MLAASMNMELLTEFETSCLPFYKHGTPAGVQHSKCPNFKSTNCGWWIARILSPTFEHTRFRLKVSNEVEMCGLH